MLTRLRCSNGWGRMSKWHRYANHERGRGSLQQQPAVHDRHQQDAMAMGLPASAIPPLPQEVNADALREARKRLSLIIASFTSSGL